MTPTEALNYLNSFINFEQQLATLKPADFKLERMQRLLERFDHPERGITFLHVAGSKGKGTTSMFAASILQAAGYRVGLYTSPHFYCLNERLRVLEPHNNDPVDKQPFGGMISDAELAGLVEAAQPTLEAARQDQALGAITFFEILTALALVHFRQQQVQYAVLETGLGGRLDATNAVDAAVCGITSIGLEHQHILGDTYEKIAVEKAAIMKSSHQRAVSAPQLPGVKAVIRDRAQRVSVQLWFVGEDISVEVLNRQPDGQTVTMHSPQRQYPDLHLSMTGDCYARNAAVAVGMIDQLVGAGHEIPAAAVAKGLAMARMPGRFEIMATAPYIILDGAHTPDACEELMRNLGQVLPLRQVILVLGCSQDKDSIGMAQRLNLIARAVVLTRSQHPRAAHLTRDQLEEFFPDKSIMVTGNVMQAMQIARERAGPEDIVLVTGSLFVAAEARQFLQDVSGEKVS